MDIATRHIVLRDRCDWLGTRAGLAVDRDGALTLARVPGPAGEKAIDVETKYPYAREVSGIALGPCDAVSSPTPPVIACSSSMGCACQGVDWRRWEPRGLAFTAQALLAADGGHGRVQHFALPALEANLAWSAWSSTGRPRGRFEGARAAIDAATKRLHRVEGNGSPDAAFDAAVVRPLVAPLFVAVGREDRVLVSDGRANRVVVFDAQGASLPSFVGPAGWLPGALAALGSRVYVADAATGSILVFDDQRRLARKHPRISGPVTAMAANANGDLYVKPGLDATYLVLRSRRSV